MEPEEEQFFNQKKIKNFTGQDLKNNLNHVLFKIEKFIKSHTYLHVTLDIDVFDETVVSATGLPCKKGLFPQEVFPVLKIISQHPNLSFDLCEVNPQKEGAEETIKLAQEIILQILKCPVHAPTSEVGDHSINDPGL